MPRFFYFRSSPLTRGACLAARPRLTVGRAGFIMPAGQRGVRGAGIRWRGTQGYGQPDIHSPYPTLCSPFLLTRL